MNNLKLAITVLAVSISGNLFSQDLLHKVPAESKFVIALNGKGFFKHASMEQLNGIFKRAGVFEKIMEDNGSFQSENIEEFGIDLNSKSYLHFNVNDSLQYFGALIPLKDKAQFESILPEESEIEVINGLNSIQTDDKTLRVSWDQHTLYILGGVAMDNYFTREDIRQKYGMLENPEYDYAEDAAAVPDTLDWEAYDYDEENTVDTIILADPENESVEEVEAAVEAAAEAAIEEAETVTIPPPPALPDDFESVDSVLERDEYQDDYYTQYSKVTAHNDSIKDVFVSQQLDAQMARLLAGELGSYKSKKMASMKDNELIHFEMDKLSNLIEYYYPTDILYGYMGRPSFDYGYEHVNSTLLVDGNKMKWLGDVTFDKEMAKYYKEIYQKKINPKFLRYVNNDALGFLSFNVNSEAYIKHMPAIVNKFYGGMDGKVSQIIDLFITAFDVVVDEKAVAKVFKGDNLFVLNGVSQKEVKYIDYEYDDDYNYKEIEKTKMEKIPDYLWMFSSDDTRVFEKILAILITENRVVDHDGIYESITKEIDQIAPYILIDKGIVFLSNNMEQLKQIKSNSYKSSASKYSSILKKNKFSLVLNTKKIPGLIDELELPVHRSMDAEIKNLSQYGDFYMISNGMKGDRFLWEAGVEFPNEGKNAVDYLINTFDNISKSLKD